MARLPYSVRFSPRAVGHLRLIERKYHSLIRRTVHSQLRSLPNVPTRNRKPLGEPASVASIWEVRFGRANRFRVFYEVSEEARTVLVLAIGIKERDRLLIAGEEFQGEDRTSS
jgi:mRNA-degrading endonuclease RelE of RelBE toxin-antitoxin system